MTLRTSDKDFLGHVDRWWSVLLPRLSRFLYSRGGPIVLTQVGHVWLDLCKLSAPSCPRQTMLHMVSLLPCLLVIVLRP